MCTNLKCDAADTARCSCRYDADDDMANEGLTPTQLILCLLVGYTFLAVYAVVHPVTVWRMFHPRPLTRA